MTTYAKSVVKEAGRAAIAAYENPAHIEDLMFAAGLAAISVLEANPEAKGRLFGLKEAAVIAGETSIGLAIYERIKQIEASNFEGHAQ